MISPDWNSREQIARPLSDLAEIAPDGKEVLT
jgi:hypothetical protein